jgi:hypothetical protein
MIVQVRGELDASGGQYNSSALPALEDGNYVELMTDGAEQNRRRAKRYPMDVPVRLGDQEGRAQDLSTRGIYFTSSNDLKLGTVIEIHLTLPNGIPTGPLHLHLFARVLRMDDLGEDQRGVACEIESWAISEFEAAKAAQG